MRRWPSVHSVSLPCDITSNILANSLRLITYVLKQRKFYRNHGLYGASIGRNTGRCVASENSAALQFGESVRRVWTSPVTIGKGKLCPRTPDTSFLGESGFDPDYPRRSCYETMPLTGPLLSGKWPAQGALVHEACIRQLNRPGVSYLSR